MLLVAHPRTHPHAFLSGVFISPVRFVTRTHKGTAYEPVIITSALADGIPPPFIIVV
jgi:hypothetical protein